MTWHIAGRALVLFAAVLALAGCAATVEMQQQELRDPTPNDGMVIGSVLVRGGKDLLGRTAWEVAVDRAERKVFAGSEYSIQAHRGGDEVVFAVTIPAGRYRIHELRQPGFSTFRANTDIHFEVQPGKTSYIGRLLVEFPEETITAFTPIRISVENAKDAIVASAEAKYRRKFHDVATHLMVSGVLAGSSIAGKSTADPRLEKDTLFMIMGMDRAERPDCNQRRVESREIVSADSKGAVEHWIIDRCGTLIRYRIAFTPNPKGGTNIGLTPGEVVGKTR